MGTPPPPVTIRLDIGAALPPAASDEQRRDAASQHLAALPQCATWVWTDGSATDGVTDGGAGALIEWPDGGELEVRIPGGSICSSFRAEMLALHSALSHLQENPAHVEDPIVVCTDSQSALASLREGPVAQSSLLGIGIWRTLKGLSESGRQIVLQWVPSHCGLRGNERADTIPKEASSLDQTTVTVDVRTAHQAAARLACTRTIPVPHLTPGEGDACCRQGGHRLPPVHSLARGDGGGGPRPCG